MHTYTYVYTFVVRNWGIWLWKLTPTLAVSKLEIQKVGSLILVQARRPENHGSWCCKPQSKQKMNNVPALSDWILFSSAFFIQALSGLDDAYPHWWGLSLFGLWIQMLIPTRNACEDTPRNMVSQKFWPPCGLGKWHIKLRLIPTSLGSSTELIKPCQSHFSF